MKTKHFQTPSFTKWGKHLPLLILVFASTIVCSSSSRLEFTNGEYRNVLVALQPSLAQAECRIILENIRNTFTAASRSLYASTEGRATFGSIKILIPSNWTMSLCGNLAEQASASDSYDDADVKISTDYVFAKTMPFTRQYRSCGEQADDIFLPVEFLQSSSLNDSVKGSILFHEWTKFRYGVFEEHGYHEDNLYPGCYSSVGTLRLSSCTNVNLDRLSDYSNSNCTNVVNQNRQALLRQLNEASTSSMSFPDIPSIQAFCTNATHNKLANTKHNAQCDRRSVSDVVLNHPDFKSVGRRRVSKNKQISINFQYLQHRTTTYQPGYAFVIEDSENIRNQSRLLYVKQSIVKMLQLISPSSQILLWTFSGRVSNGPEFYGSATDATKASLVEKIPDNAALPFISKLSPKMAKQAEPPNNLEFALQTVTDITNTLANYKWEIFLITSSPSEAFESARNILHSNSPSLTVLTFDLDKAWLQLYSTPAVRNIIYLPDCGSPDGIGNECHAKIHSLSVGAFIDADRNNVSPLYYQKITEAEVTKDGSNTILIPTGLSAPASRSNFHIILPKFVASDAIAIRSPIGTNCPCISVAGYDFVVRLDTSILGCEFRTGVWNVDLSRVSGSNVHLVQVFLSSIDNPNTLLRIKGSLGIPRDSLLYPTSQLIPAFVRVTNSQDQPVLDADVKLRLFSSLNSSWSSQLDLFDNGLHPDVIKNDGVYSSYIQSFYPNSAPHNAEISVDTLTKSAIAVTSLTSENSAVLINIEGSSKCCGSLVPVGTTSLVGPSKHTSFVPGFYTDEDFDNSKVPPAKIGTIEVLNDDAFSVTLHFIAPGGTSNTGSVDFYETCCSFTDPFTNVEESSCNSIKPSENCVPVQDGLNQTCVISRQIIFNDFLSQIPTSPPTTIALYCGIRGVNSNSISGELSSTLVEILVSLPLLTECESNQQVSECNSISDGCLPIAVFWGLIGCICGLVLIIIALLLCMIRRKSSKKSSQEVLMSRGRGNSRQDTPSNLPDKDSPLYKVYVNKAYIQEADGQMRMVAADGELLPSDFEGPSPASSSSRPTISGPIPSVRRRSVSVSDLNNKNPSNPVWTGSNQAIQDDMPIFKPQLPTQVNSGYSQGNLYSEEASKAFGNSRSSAPVPKNRLSRKTSGYANSNLKKDSSPQRPASAIGVTRESSVPVVPVYASVSRNGRRPLSNSNQPIGSLLNSEGTSTFISSRPNQRETITPDRIGIVPNRFSRPSSGYQSEVNPSLPRSRPPSSRLDAFPSSDSDTYSDMSRGIPMAPRPPPVPPPFPKEDSSNMNPSIPTDRFVIKQSSQLPPVPPPKYVPPPPAPPSKNFMPKQQPYKANAGPPQSDEEYDDDSEHWDDEDFDFNPGVSYA